MAVRVRLGSLLYLLALTSSPLRNILFGLFVIRVMLNWKCFVCDRPLILSLQFFSTRPQSTQNGLKKCKFILSFFKPKSRNVAKASPFIRVTFGLLFVPLSPSLSLKQRE